MKSTKLALLGLLALTLGACKTEEKSQINLIPAENFQKEINGKQVNLYTLQSEYDGRSMAVQVTNYGARIVSIWTQGKDGIYRDVALGRNTIDEYLVSEEKFYGSTVGRYANRIAKGQFTLDEQTYQLDINDGKNHLHGGSKGYFAVVWDAKPYKTEAGEDAILLTYLSPDGEMGYPGNLNLELRMILSENKIRIEYSATTDAPTVVNLSHHSYFNLNGEGSETILDHNMRIYGSNYTPTDAELIPTGEIATVVGTPLDFTSAYPIGDRINDEFEALKLGGGYDHNWVLDKPQGTFGKAAQVHCSESGILMEVYTDEPGIQFYSGNFMTGNDVGKSGKPYGFRSAFCLETQKYPDSPNHPDFPSTTLLPGETYSSVCVYEFFVATP